MFSKKNLITGAGTAAAGVMAWNFLSSQGVLIRGFAAALAGAIAMPYAEKLAGKV